LSKLKIYLKKIKKIISDIKKRINSGDEPGFFEKISVKRGRGSRSGDIEDLIDEIEDNLNDEQKIKFEKIDKPYLPELNKADITGEN